MTIRNKFSMDLKLDTISLALEQGYTRIEAAKSLGINANMLGRWIKAPQIYMDAPQMSNKTILHFALLHEVFPCFPRLRLVYRC